MDQQTEDSGALQRRLFQHDLRTGPRCTRHVVRIQLLAVAQARKCLRALQCANGDVGRGDEMGDVHWRRWWW
jgi:hypothetical protein